MLKSIRPEAEGAEPGVRAYVLDRVGSGLSRCSPRKAGSAFTAAFKATLGIPDEAEDIKVDLQTTILKHLLKVDEPHIERWLGFAESDAQTKVRTAMISGLTAEGKLDQALEVLHKVPADNFPYEQASNLILAYQRHRDSKVLQVAGIALASYQQEHQLCPGCFDLANLIVRCWNHLPASWVIEAVNEVLEDADKSPESATIEYGVAFASEHEYLASELMPVILQLDKNEADNLFEMYPDLRSKVDSTSQVEQRVVSDFSRVQRKKKRQDFANKISEITYDDKVLELAKLAKESPRQAIAAADVLPLTVEKAGAAPEPERTNPRAEALIAVAYANAARNGSAAEAAIKELLNSMDEMDAFKGVDFCVRAANVASFVGNMDLARQSLSQGIRYYERLYASDTNADDPNLTLKAWWPSVAAVSKLVLAAYEMGLDRFEQTLQISDPDVMLLLRMRLASEMIGVPQELTIRISKKNSHRNLTTRFED